MQRTFIPDPKATIDELKEFATKGIDDAVVAPTDIQERWSYCCDSLDCARTSGELILCPMRRKWQPLYQRIAAPKPVTKSYQLKEDERWITVHPNGEENKGQPVLIKEHEDGSASIIAGVGGKLNGLRLRKTKSKEDYQRELAKKKEQIKQQQQKEREAEQTKLKQMPKEERAQYQQQQKTKRQIKTEGRRRAQARQKENLYSTAETIAQTMGWQPVDVDASFATEITRLEKELDATTDKQKQDELLSAIASQERTKTLAKERQAKQIIARAKDHMAKFKRDLTIDDELREAAQNQIDLDSDTLVSTQLKDQSGLGIKKEYSQKAALDKQEREIIQQSRDRKLAEQYGEERVRAIKKAQKSLKANNEVIERLLGNTEYAAPEDTQAKIDTLKTMLAYDKTQKQTAQAKKKIEDLPIDSLTIAQLKKELQDAQFGQGIYVNRTDLNAALAQAEQSATTERQAALNSQLHESYKGQAVGQQKWLANGAYNALNSAMLDIWSMAGLNRDIVDIIGANNAAKVMAAQIKEWHEDPAAIAAAAQAFHTETNEELARDALEEGQSMLDMADQLNQQIQANSAEGDLALLKDLVERKQSLIDRASAKMGQTLGGIEASAALSYALQYPDDSELTVNLGHITQEQAALQAKVLGLSLADVDISAVRGERLVSIPKENWHKIKRDIDSREAQVRRQVREIKAGMRDQRGWLPEGIVSRPFDSFTAPDSEAKVEGKQYTPAEGLSSEQQINQLETLISQYNMNLRGNLAQNQLNNQDDYKKINGVATFYDGIEEIDKEIKERQAKKEQIEELETIKQQFKENLLENLKDIYTLETQKIEDNDQLKEAMHRSLMQVPEAGMVYKQPKDLTPQEQTSLRRYWENNLYAGSMSEYVDADLRARQQGMRKDLKTTTLQLEWNQFVREHDNNEDVAFSVIKQDLIDNHSTKNMFGEKELPPLAAVDPEDIESYRSLPEATELFGTIQDLKQALETAKQYSDEELKEQGITKLSLESKLAKEQAELPAKLQSLYRKLMQNHAVKQIRGIKQQSLDLGEGREIQSPWGEYIRIHGNVNSARQAVLDSLRSNFHKQFKKNYAAIAKKVLKQNTYKMRNSQNHVMGLLDEETRTSYKQRQQKALQSAMAQYAHKMYGRFASGARKEGGEKLLAAFKAADARQSNIFGATELKQDDGTDITTLGTTVEMQLAKIMPKASEQFYSGQKIKVFPNLQMDNEHVAQQRAVKMLEAAKKIQLSFGTGSGKSLVSIGAYAHLQEQGKAKRALFVVPSAVQEQFGGEMLQYTKPQKFKWESRAGLTASERLAALKESKNQINVVTHQSLRDDLLSLMAEYDGTDTEQAKKSFNGMNENQRAAHLHTVMQANGIDHDMLVFDEGHLAVDRQGKQDSTLSNIMGALGRNAKYYMRQSATPIKNDLSEAYHMLHSLDPIKYRSWNDFNNRYGLDTAASKRALQIEIDRYNYANPSETGVVRRNNQHKVSLTEQQQKAYQNVQDAAKAVTLANSRQTVDINATKLLSPNSFVGRPESEHQAIAQQLSKAVGTLRNEAENRIINQFEAKYNGKIQQLNAIVAKQNSGKDKVPGIVFAHNRESVRQIEQALKAQGHRVVHLDGSHSGKDKERIKNEFNPTSGKDKDRKHDIIVMTDAGATGMNLQNAKYLVNFDLPETSWVKEQREGRIDRHGQLHREIDYHDLVSDTEHDRTKLARIKRKAELGAIFQLNPNFIDDRGILSYMVKAQAEQNEQYK